MRHTSLPAINLTNPNPKLIICSALLRQQQRKSTPQRRTSLLDHILRAALFSLALYALLVCPSDTTLSSPTCRAIHSWRLTLEPRLTPPIQHILAHPRIAPLVATIKPHVDRVSPVWVQVQNATGPRLRALRVRTRRWSKPYVRKLQLEYDARVKPYVARLQPYVDLAKPHVYEAQRRLQRAWLGVEPHLRRAQVLVLEFIENVLKPFVENTVKPFFEHTVKPFYDTTIKPKLLDPVWAHAQAVPGWLDARFGDRVRDLKRTYVDEQLGKMRAKIEEFGGRGRGSSAYDVQHEKTATETITETGTNPTGGPTATVLSAKEKVTAVVESLLSRATASSSSSSPSSSSSSSSSVSVSSSVPLASSISSLAAPSVATSVADEVIPSAVIEDIAPSVVSVVSVVSASTAAVESTAAAPPAEPHSTASSSVVSATPEVEHVQAILSSDPDTEGGSNTVDAAVPEPAVEPEPEPEPEEDPLDFLASFTSSPSDTENTPSPVAEAPQAEYTPPNALRTRPPNSREEGRHRAPDGRLGG